MAAGNEKNIAPIEEKRAKIFGVEVAYIALLGIAVAFLGWFLENTFRFFRGINVDSRFNILPFIAPYMSLPFIFHLVFDEKRHIRVLKAFRDDSKKSKIISHIITYLFLSFGVFALEFIIGNMWDIFFGVTLWNYSNLPFNFTKFTSPVTTFGFGFFAYVLLNFVMPPALKLVRTKIKYKTAKWVSLILGSLVILDTVRMAVCIIAIGEAPHLWTWDIRNGVFTWLP